MAIALSWASPLQNALMQKLSDPSLSVEEFEKLNRAVGLLDGTLGAEVLAREVEKCRTKFEQRYQEAIRKTEKSRKSSDIELGITELRGLGSYRDAPQKIEEAYKRINVLKKRKKITIITIAAAVCLFITGMIIRSGQEKKRIDLAISEAQKLADEGRAAEAVDAVTALCTDNVTGDNYPLLYSVSETVLEQTLLQDGAVAAFAQLDGLRESVPKAVDAKRFYTFAKDRLSRESELPPAERWQLMRLLKKHDSSFSIPQNGLELFESYLATLSAADAWDTMRAALGDNLLKVPDELIADTYQAYVGGLSAEEVWDVLLSCRKSGLLGKLPQQQLTQQEKNCLDFLTAELRSGSKRDMKAWTAESSNLLASIKADPDALLAFLYALNDAGYDVAELFPAGIPVDIPVAGHVTSLNSHLQNDDGVFPEIRTYLPISIREDSFYGKYNTSSILNIVDQKSNEFNNPVCSTSESALKKAVYTVQAEDSHYKVTLLTQYLFSVPESMRPASFSECTTLYCMQNSYLRGGVIQHQKSYKNTPYLNSNNYYSLFSALDMVAVYDVADINRCQYISYSVHPAQAEDDEWFEAHKDQSGWFKADNMEGRFDPEALRQDYEESMEYLEIWDTVMLLNSLFNNDYEEDMNDDAA